MTTLSSIRLLASKCADIVAIAKRRYMVELYELIALRRRVGSTGSTNLSACIESYDWVSRKTNVGDVYNC